MRKLLCLAACVLIGGCATNTPPQDGFTMAPNGKMYYTTDTSKCVTSNIRQSGQMECFDEKGKFTGNLYPLTEEQIKFYNEVWKPKMMNRPPQQVVVQQAPAQPRDLGIQHCHVTNRVTGATSCYSY